MEKNYPFEKIGFIKIHFLLLSLFLGISISLNAQSTANYTTNSLTTGSLVLDRNSNTVNMSTGTTSLISAGQNGVASAVTNIGFDFYLMSNRFTQFSVNDDGILQLGGTAVGANLYTINTGTTALPKLSAFNADMRTGTTSGKVHYKLIGTSPNRVLVVEFLNMQLFNTTAAAGTSTWQMRLYETSGMIEYVYGAMNVTNIGALNRSPSIGFYTGSGTGSFVSYSILTGTFSTTSPYAANAPLALTGNITALNSSTDGNRRLLRFSPPGISDHASITSLASPTGINFTSVTSTGMTVNWTAASPTTGIIKYAVYNSTDNVTFTYVNSVTLGTNSLAVTGLSAGTTYYWKVYPLSEGTLGTSLNGISYCTPSPSSVDGTGITKVVFSTVSNSTGAETNNYGNYSSQIGTGVKGTNVPISITTNTPFFIIFNLTYNVKIWVDWNNDSDFADTGEEVYSGSVTSNTLAGIIAIPSTATLGNHRVRIGAVYNSYTPTPCYTGSNGAYEDYTLNVTAPAPCTSAPVVTTGPPNRSISAGTNTTFTSIITNAPDSYIWEVSTDGGVNYTTITNGGVYTNATTATLSITGALGSMTGFLYRVKATNACGSVTSSSGTLTVTTTYCTPSSSSSTIYIEGLASTGTLLDVVSNSSSGFTSGGYDNNSSITIARQIPGGAINFDIDVAGATQSYIDMYVDWNSNGTFDTPSEEVYVAGAGTFDTTFGFVVPITQAPGNYRMRLRTRSSSTITPCATGYTTGETEDFTISIVADCASKITSVINGSNCGPGAVTLGATSDGGATEFRWYSAETGGSLLATTSTGSWTISSVTSTTTYYVTSYNGSCESLIRVAVKAIINPISNITFSPAVPLICGSGTILTLTASGDTTVDDLFTEDFESGGFGNFTLNTIYATNGAEPFAVRTSSYLPTNTVAFKPAMNSGGAGTTNNKFAFTTSDINNDGSSGASNTTTLNTALETTTAINTVGFSDLTLTFDHYYSDYSPTADSVIIEVNTGSGWTTFTTYTTDQGTPGAFASITLDFTPYINQSNFKFRFRYVAKWNDGYALDNVRLYGTRPLSTTFDWGVNTGDMYSDSNATVPYVSHALLSTVYIKPDVTLSSLWTYTVSTTLLNGCTINKTISIPNKTKIWKGAAAAPDYTTASSWFPAGIPDATNCVEIFNVTAPIVYPIIGSTAYAKTLTLKQSGATLNINSGQTLTVTDKVTVASGATLNIANSGSLVQITDGITNSGNITMTRTSRSMYRYDYVYHGSPVAGDIFSQIPSAYDVKYKFVTNGSAYGAWNTLTSTTIGEGFIARVKNVAPYSTTPTAIDFTYTGVPNNGTINMTIDSYDTSSNVSGNTKLFANPYPSAIDAGTFITANPILGAAIYLWTSHTVYSGTGLYPMADYIVWTKLGGTTVSPGGLTTDGKIAAGQGFFAQTFGDGTVSFNNTMRVAGSNTNFFKANSSASDEPEMSRIWLNISNDTLFHQILLGYAPGASYGYDNLYDGLSFTTGEMDLYSIVGDKLLAVQGRPLPFDPNDVVPLGYKITTPGNYTIAIDHVDGLFLNDQDIYLEDKLLNVVHNIKAGPYTFTATAGSFNDRFDIRYINPLGVDNPKDNTSLNAFISNDKIFVNASQNIINIDVYDISGKLIRSYYPKLHDKIFTDDFVFAKGIYIAKVKLENGLVVSEKIIN